MTSPTSKLPKHITLVVIYGPPASGKTINAEKLKNLYSCEHICEERLDHVAAAYMASGVRVLLLSNQDQKWWYNRDDVAIVSVEEAKGLLGKDWIPAKPTMTTPSYIIPNLKGEPTFASNIPGFRSLVGPEQWHYAPELMPQVIEFLRLQQGRMLGEPLRPLLVGETLHTGDYVLSSNYIYIFYPGKFSPPDQAQMSPTTLITFARFSKFSPPDQAWLSHYTVLTTRPMPDLPNATSPLIEKIEQLLTYPMDNRARVLLTLALDIERGKATAQ